MERRRIRGRKSEEGIALLISIFVLLLISVVAISLVVSSGTESALAGNYRSATGVYDAAMAGLEEVRARLRPNSPISFKNTDPLFLPAGTPLDPCSPVYVINPLGGETVAPWDPASTYPDTEFNQEFTGICPAGSLPPNPSPRAFSIWNTNPLNGLPFPGPSYKWVRINGVTEQSLKLDVVPYDGTWNDATPIYYDGTLNNNSSGSQVLEVTALAVLPNGSQKLVQYLVSSVPISLPPFPAAMTLAGSGQGNTVGYSAPASNAGFSIKGNDQDCNGGTLPGAFPAIGVFDSMDVGTVVDGGDVNGVHFTGIPTPPSSIRLSYTGTVTGTPPDVERVDSSFTASSMSTPSELDAAVQSIIQNADATVPSTGQTSFLTNLVSSGAMSSSSPLTVVVNGDLDLTGWHNTGYGLLLVTGTLTYDPDASWNGIVMVVGQGTVIGWRGGSGIFNGTMLVARTRDTSGNLISGSYLSYSYVDFNHGGSMGGQGIRYSSCWIQRSQPSAGYRVLSFHEISQ